MLATTFRSVFVGCATAWLVVGISPPVAPSVVRPVTQAMAQSVGQPVKPSATQSATPPPPAKPASEPPADLPQQTEKLWQKYRISLILVGAAATGYLGVLLVRPLWLLKLPSADIALPQGLKIPLSAVRWLKYGDRTLNAWVNQHWQTAETAFFGYQLKPGQRLRIRASSAVV